LHQEQVALVQALMQHVAQDCECTTSTATCDNTSNAVMFEHVRYKIREALCRNSRYVYVDTTGIVSLKQPGGGCGKTKRTCGLWRYAASMVPDSKRTSSKAFKLTSNASCCVPRAFSVSSVLCLRSAVICREQNRLRFKRGVHLVLF